MPSVYILSIDHHYVIRSTYCCALCSRLQTCCPAPGSALFLMRPPSRRPRFPRPRVARALVKAFKDNDYYGLDDDFVKFFSQSTLPCLSAEGKFLMDSAASLIAF